MTLKEKVAQIEPDKIQAECYAGVVGCPCHYEYLNLDITEEKSKCDKQRISVDRCIECWNREFHEVSNTVNHPSHYKTCKYECIDVMIETQGAEAVASFCLCNVFKYLYRHKLKNGIEDIKKAQWYLNKYIELEENTNEEKNS